MAKNETCQLVIGLPHQTTTNENLKHRFNVLSAGGKWNINTLHLQELSRQRTFVTAIYL
jgi:hypothetical protein